METDAGLQGELRIVSLAVRLGACEFGGPLSAAEASLVERSGPFDVVPEEVTAARRCLLAGGDPLGDASLHARPRARRRRAGAVYTPLPLVSQMTGWIVRGEPDRVVDAGCGSGRFAVAAARHRPEAEIVAIDVDAMATLMTRAALAVAQHRRARVLNADYTAVQLPTIDGRTAFLGNPPYIRHQKLDRATKSWAKEAARELDLHVSGLAGLHALFFLATARLARHGDSGCLVTSGQWLDARYGEIVRRLLLERLGFEAIYLHDPAELAFPDAETTAVVVCFWVGEPRADIRAGPLHSGGRPGALDGGTLLPRAIFEASTRWGETMAAISGAAVAGAGAAVAGAAGAAATDATGPRASGRRHGYVQLGEIAAVHRGAATGANAIWVGDRSSFDLPAAVLYPTVTHGAELFAAGERLTTVDHLRVVADLPRDLDTLDPKDRERVARFLELVLASGARDTYIARNRRPWWRVRLRAPAPILASYMAHRTPAFVRNDAGAGHINVAHGIYPRLSLSALALDRLAATLRNDTTVSQGRTYAGGLIKFEPGDLERLLVPAPDLLEAQDWPPEG